MFDRANAKKKNNYNDRIIRPKITWSIYLIHLILQLFNILYQINTSFLKKKRFTHFIKLLLIKKDAWAQVSKGDYL